MKHHLRILGYLLLAPFLLVWIVIMHLIETRDRDSH